MQSSNDNNKRKSFQTPDNEKSEEVKKDKQQKTDPQITEYKGFFDPKEDLEPDVKNDPDSKQKKK